MKVVVLDDEERVCKLVCALIPWSRMDLELAGTAADGVSGLDLIKRENPDLLITDIRMPGMDGLKLIESAKAFNENLQVIIISGYRQFDYAQQAIKFGVSDYLLKPLKQQELEEALKKMLVIYHEQQATLAVRNNLKTDKNTIRNYYLEKLIKEKEGGEKFTSFFHSSDLLCLCLVKVDGDFSEYDDKARDVIREKLKATCSPYLTSFPDWELIYSPQLKGFPLLLCYDYDQRGMIKTKLREALLALCVTFQELFENLQVSLSIGEEVDSPALLDISVQKAVATSYLRLDHIGERFLYSEHAKASMDSNLIKTSKQLMEQMLISDLASSEQIALHIIEPLEHLDSATFFPTVAEIATKCADLVATLSPSSPSFLKYINKLPYLGDRKQILENLHLALHEGYMLVEKTRQEDSARPIKLAKTYILEHYGDSQLSLESVSDLIKLNSTYFSALFKKNENQGFAQYVKDTRMQAAKKLLVSTNIQIKEIAEKVGYRDPKLFAKCFKKALGIKPLDYRKLYG